MTTTDSPAVAFVKKHEPMPPKTPINWKAWGSLAVVMVLAVLAITFFVTRGDDGQAERAQQRTDLRNRALDGLTGRFNDASINPKVNITRLEWVGDQMMIDYSQGKERCTSIVIVPEQPGGLFDIVPVGDTDPSKWGPNVPHCYTISNSDPLP